MFKTFMGPVEEDAAVIYLRPETAQGSYVNFKNVQQASRKKLPFGIAQIGKSFRNEISPGNFVFRMREFEQMEMQYFVRPEAAAAEAFEMWLPKRRAWYERYGVTPERLRLREHAPDELAHYAKKAVDVEYRFPFGWKELEGVHNRGDFDLSRHSEASGEKLEYFDQATDEHVIPWVVETAAGADRAAFTFLIDAYREEEVRGETRVSLALHPDLAPYKVAVLPLLKKRPEIVELCHRIKDDLKRHTMAVYDDTAAIGKLYRRQDEIGTPWCVTVDVESLEDGAVTVRDRDTMAQERIPVEGVTRLILDRLEAARADARGEESIEIKVKPDRRSTLDRNRARPVRGGPRHVKALVPEAERHVGPAAERRAGAASVRSGRGDGRGLGFGEDRNLGRRVGLGGRSGRQPAIDGRGRALAVAHREDDRRGAADDVATGEDPVHAGHPVLVGRDVPVVADLEIRCRGGQQRVRACPDGHHDHVARDLEFGPGDRRRARTPGRVGLAELHPDAADRADPARLVAEHLDRRDEEVEPDAFLFGVVGFLGSRRQFVPAAPVDDDGLLGAKPSGRPDARPSPRCRRRRRPRAGRAAPGCLRVGVPGAHQVDPGQVLVGGVDPLEVLARDVHEDRQPRTDREEDRVEAARAVRAACRSCR